RALHEGEPIVIPNPWDAGSAQALAKLGFKALASTSGGFAQTLGRSDGEVSRDEVVEHARALARATDLPISMDLEHGYGPESVDVALTITRVAAAGAVGGSIEDWDPGGFIYEVGRAAERVAAAAEAVRALDFPFTLTARAENHVRGIPNLDDTIRRLQAYEAAGADVLYAPGLRTVEEIRVVCAAVTKPVNVLSYPDMSMDRIAAAGAQRVSVPWLLKIALNAAVAAATEIRETGDFPALSPGNTGM
ncbi:MAG: isocitrate lyase/PEP mutase family protein, partial [Pseudonocardiaceae bacterium]